MKAATARCFGTEEVLAVVSDFPKPEVTPKSKTVLIRVQACSLSPSDCRMLSGDADVVKKPKNGFPYVPGGDICGIVEQTAADGEDTKFKVGDAVIGTWTDFGEGGLAEYAIVKTSLVEKLPSMLTPIEGAAVADSSVNAMLAVRDAKIKNGDRVLILGGSGGLGTALIQLVRDAGASYIAATSTDVELLDSLGVDRAVNYKKENWWELEEWKADKFDVLFDCAEGRTAWKKAKRCGILKSGRQGGRFRAIVAQDWHIVMHSFWDMFKWFIPVVGRQLSSSVCFIWLPKYRMQMPGPRGNSSAELLKLVEEKRLRVVVEPGSPYPFTTEGVQAAFRLHGSRRAKGKVVIAVEPYDASGKPQTD